MNEKEWMNEYFRRLQDNKVIWVKRDSEITTLTFWEKPLLCEREGCNRETHLTSEGPVGFHHPICEKCYLELHAYHITLFVPFHIPW